MCSAGAVLTSNDHNTASNVGQFSSGEPVMERKRPSGVNVVHQRCR